LTPLPARDSAGRHGRSRRRYHLDEPGAQVEVIEEEGQIVLRPMLPVDASQAWFWNKEWQDGEREAASEAEVGLGQVFDSERRVPRQPF